ncbi:MAG: hypothetical protein ACREGR_05220, partial [Minisyncoccia bacterium]
MPEDKVCCDWCGACQPEILASRSQYDLDKPGMRPILPVTTKPEDMTMSDETTTKLDHEKVFALQEEYAAKAQSHEAREYIENARFHFEGYAEPGYNDPASGVVATGNWNRIYGREDINRPEDTTPAEFGEALGELGVELEWEDE